MEVDGEEEGGGDDVDMKEEVDEGKARQVKAKEKRKAVMAETEEGESTDDKKEELEDV